MKHKWHIDESEYQRHEQRRGTRHAFGALEPQTTCLVVVDMVPFFVDANAYAQGVVSTIATLAGALRSAGGTVAWIVPCDSKMPAARREFFGDEVADMYRQSGGDGTPRQRVQQNFDVDQGDLVFEKQSPSAFFPGMCDLHETLQSIAIETVLIAGTVASVCCESSARDASTLGYRTIFVADAVAAVSDNSLNATLRTIYRSFGDVRSASDVRALITSRV